MNFDKEMVQKILLGQENLDRMRAEISHLISMLVGMISDKERSGVAWYRFNMQVTSKPVKSKEGSGYWQLDVSDEKIDVSFFLKEDQVYRFEGRWQNPKYVELVYSQLPKLLEQFVDKFPSLTERLKPFIKAAEVKF